MTSAPSVVMTGDVGLALADLQPGEIEALRSQLTRSARAWDDNPAEEVCCLRDDGNYVWVPRYYDISLWPRVESWDWTDGEPYPFKLLATLDPERDQPNAVAAMTSHLVSYQGGILVAPTGTGKCLGRGTPVLMADGCVKPVEEIVVGDRLMGPSGESRQVLSTTTGNGPLYRITPIKGEPWICNDVHVLTLVRTDTNAIIDVPLDEWQKKNRTFKHLHKQFSVGIETFEREPKPPSIDPYFLGVWFGDGAKTLRSLATEPAALSVVQVSKPDPEIRALCEDTARAWGLRCWAFDLDRCPTYALSCDDERDGHGHFTKSNPLLVAMRALVGPKIEVPDSVKRGSRATRLAFLAGFLDADAELTCNCFSLTQKREDWARAAWWIARSLGFCATITTRKSRDQHGTEGLYHVVTISGAVDQIPTRIERKRAKPRKQKKVATRTGFTVAAIGEGTYHGFTLDGDGRFLLGDFTVTHNTLMGCAVAAALGRKIAVPVYVGHMADNWTKHFKSVLGLTDDDIGIVQGDRCDIGKPVTIISVQTVLSRGLPPELRAQIGTLVCDEVHRYGAKVWREIVAQFPARFRLGLSANPVREDGLDDVISWSFGAVGYRAARKRNALVRPPSCVMIHYPKTYDYGSYCKWRKVGPEWRQGDPHPTKYDAVLAKDHKRSVMLADEIARAARAGRCVLVMSRLVDHLEDLRAETVKALQGMHPVDRILKNVPFPADYQPIEVGMLEAGSSPEERDRVSAGNVIFATYQMARDALNIPKLDTLFLATPPGSKKVLQPIGRLREKVEGIERKPLLVVDCYEGEKFAKGRANKRRDAYRQLGMDVKEVTRSVGP